MVEMPLKSHRGLVVLVALCPQQSVAAAQPAAVDAAHAA
jgi:hypothetical protein